LPSYIQDIKEEKVNQPKANRQLNVHDLWDMKVKGEKFTLLTAGDFNTAQMVDEAGIEITGGGGALDRMVFGGEPHSFRATMQDVLRMVEKIAPAVKRAMVLASLPFGSYYQESDETAIHCGIQLIQAGAHIVKVEGVSDTLLSRMKALIEVGVPVAGHVGLSPSFMRKIGGYKVVGKTSEQAFQVYRHVKKLEEIGIGLIEMECVPERVATEICKRTPVPILGTGSGPGTDGQGLMHADLLGLQRTLVSRLAKQYVDLWPIYVDTFSKFAEEVRGGIFPTSENTFSISDNELEQFMEYVEKNPDGR
jgi:3-methyl-2-oxobutanoate hydroxymethyltransferase